MFVSKYQYLDHQQMLEPTLAGGWSIKDTIAHITEWEQAMLTWLDQLQRGGVPDRPPFGLKKEKIDEINANYYQTNREKSLEQVLEESHDSYQQAYEIIHNTPDADLFQPDRFAWLDGNPFWPVVAANTCWHYQEHVEEFNKYLQSRG